MKKIFCTLFLMVAFGLSGGNITTQIRKNNISSDDFKKFKWNNQMELEFEGSFPLVNQFNLWANCYLLKKHGSGLEFENPSLISGGLKYFFIATPAVLPYLGLGISFSDIEKFETYSFEQKIRNREFGYVGKSGLLFFENGCIFVDIFADYYFSKYFSKQNLHLNGILQTGAGIGIGF